MDELLGRGKWSRPERVTVLNDTRIETISDAIADLAIYWRSKLTSNEPIIVVIDSIAALDSIEAIDAKMADGKAEMGNRAKQIYKMFRIRNELFYRLGVTMVCINQLRSKLGAGFGQDTSTTPGGAALKFYASIRLAFYSGKTLKIKYKGKERRAGKYVTVQMKRIRYLLLGKLYPKLLYILTQSITKLALTDTSG